MAAVLASGYRPSSSEPGHHQLVLQILPKTIGLEPERIRVLDAYRRLRNLSDYQGDEVSDHAAQGCAAEARRLLDEVCAWVESRKGA